MEDFGKIIDYYINNNDLIKDINCVYSKKTKISGKTIDANYPYAGVLDKGRHMTNRGMRGSEQAPKGMTKPTFEYIKKRLRQIVRGK